MIVVLVNVNGRLGKELWYETFALAQTGSLV